ncbi:MAG: flavin reductase (DIM6/NTAB) family NADH-FMN oxidoreductase RutF [Vicingaceae bacterium]|jgi:flavin reductase (DIM6/NTAB) family NADH-FMN oxidoreductase RutF
MRSFNKEEIKSLDKIFRLNLINSVSGYKSANLIGTIGEDGENLAIFSSVVHLGANPALLGFIMRPAAVPRNTLTNIKQSQSFTINSISEKLIQKAHYTSANFDIGVSEFKACGLTPEYISDFEAPFIKESKLKLAMRLEQIIDIELNDTMLIIGSIENIYVDEIALTKNGQLDLNAIDTVAISGLNRYHKVEEIGNFPYARVSELPVFK